MHVIIAISAGMFFAISTIRKWRRKQKNPVILTERRVPECPLTEHGSAIGGDVRKLEDLIT
jgi:hypothetical protein